MFGGTFMLRIGRSDEVVSSGKPRSVGFLWPTAHEDVREDLSRTVPARPIVPVQVGRTYRFDADLVFEGYVHRMSLEVSRLDQHWRPSGRTTLRPPCEELSA